MRLTRYVLAGLATVGIVVLASATGCGVLADETPPVLSPIETSTVTGVARPLAEVEVREYEGERLDSAGGWPENSIKGPQDVDIGTYRLAVVGLVEKPARYTYDEMKDGFTSYEKVVRLYCVEGWSARVLWRGVLVRDILDASGVTPEARSIIFSAADGYTTSFPVEYFYDNDILLAYAINDAVLPKDRGYPFALVAEDKWGYKWCRWVVSLEATSDPDPGGYWEDRGYNNSGDRDRPFYAN